MGQYLSDNREIHNMAFKTLLLVCLVATTLAAPAHLHAHAGDHAPANYEFQYGVKDDYSGNDFGQQESRDGDYTQGSYYVLLPDGRLQKVTYSVNGDSGYVAEVSYE